MRIEVTDVRAERERAPAPEVVPGIGMPKALFFLAALLSFAMSIHLFISGDREQGLFVGLWVPSILAAGTLLHSRNGHE